MAPLERARRSRRTTHEYSMTARNTGVITSSACGGGRCWSGMLGQRCQQPWVLAGSSCSKELSRQGPSTQHSTHLLGDEAVL